MCYFFDVVCVGMKCIGRCLQDGLISKERNQMPHSYDILRFPGDPALYICITQSKEKMQLTWEMKDWQVQRTSQLQVRWWTWWSHKPSPAQCVLFLYRHRQWKKAPSPDDVHVGTKCFGWGVVPDVITPAGGHCEVDTCLLWIVVGTLLLSQD